MARTAVTCAAMMLWLGVGADGGAVGRPSTPGPTSRATTQPARSENLRISVELNRREAFVHAGQPVMVRVVITNVAAEPRELVIRTLDAYHAETIFRVANENGGEIPLTRYGLERKERRESRIRNQFAHVLKPNEAYEERFCLSREFDMSTAGTYVVTASRSVPKTTMRRMDAVEPPVELQSEPLKIVVRDFAEEGRPEPKEPLK